MSVPVRIRVECRTCAVEGEPWIRRENCDCCAAALVQAHKQAHPLHEVTVDALPVEQSRLVKTLTQERSAGW